MLAFSQNIECVGLSDAGCLKAEKTCNDLKVILDAVMGLLEHGFSLSQRGSQLLLSDDLVRN